MKNSNKKMLKYFKNIKFWIFIFSIITLIDTTINIFNPIINANLVTSITIFNINESIKLAFALLIIMLLGNLIGHFLNHIYLKKIKPKLIYNIRKDMIKTIFEMKTLNFDNHSSGEFSEKLKQDPEVISQILSIFQYNIFGLLQDVIILFYVFFLNYIIGIAYLLSIILIYCYEQYKFKNYEEIHMQSSKAKEKTSTILNESMRGMRDVKQLNISNSLYNIICNSLGKSTEYDLNTDLKYRNILEVVNIIKTITTAIIILTGIFLIKFDMLTITSFFVIFMYRSNIFDLFFCYSSIKQSYTDYKVASERIFELYDDEKYPKEEFGNKILKSVKGKIDIKNLSFSYETKKVLNNINIEVKPKETIAIVGASGSGKTTLLNLLCRSYDVDNNTIFIDNNDINTLSKNSLRNNISIISQNPYLFNLSIKDNLKLVDEKLSNKKMIEICKIAQIDDYINQLPNTYDTILGEGGINLSGGQKQRLAIARALIKNSKIILFDEATSALDNITQKKLQDAINKISKDYTIIIVAHRLSTIKQCSKIYVIEHGKVVGEGTHDDLLKSNKYYKKLYNEEIV